MQVLVVGAGIIGSIYGWTLAESGHHVVHLVRSGRSAALRDGLPLDMFDRRKGHKRNFRGLYRLNAVETLSPRDAFELVIVPVKHYASLETLKGIVPSTPFCHVRGTYTGMPRQVESFGKANSSRL